MYNQLTGSMYQTLVESGNIRYSVHPLGGAGIAAVSDGVVAAWAISPYVEIVAAAVIVDPTWLIGISFHTGVVETFYGEIVIASGAAGFEVPLAIIPVVAGIPSAVGVAVAGPYNLPFPIKIVGTPRLAAAVYKSTAASAAGGTLKVLVATAIGT